MKKTLLENLEWSVRALAQPAEIQAKLFPSFVPPAEELALTFDDCLKPTLPKYREIWSEVQIRALSRIDEKISAMSGPNKPEIWLTDDCLSHPHWSEVRSLASEALAAFGWSSVAPAPSGAVYVPGSGDQH